METEIQDFVRFCAVVSRPNEKWSSFAGRKVDHLGWSSAG
jgi:hypothetical protein